MNRITIGPRNEAAEDNKVLSQPKVLSVVFCELAEKRHTSDPAKGVPAVVAAGSEDAAEVGRADAIHAVI